VTREPARATVFLDRDGVLNRKPAEGEYVTQAGDLELLPGAARACALLRAAGARLVVVTNQRGVALGRMGPGDLEAVHGRLGELLAAEGGALDAIYACPHERGVCDCRKPAPGLFLRAAADDPAIDLGRAAMVGDSPVDVEAAHRLGLPVVLVAAEGSDAEHVAPSLEAAVPWLLGRLALPPTET
jgi:D-glycero-D-manno-heptose 1,7-bisphosphate phosphatase